MTRCSPLLLMIWLTCRAGLPLLAQGDPGNLGRVVIEEVHTTGRIQPVTADGNRAETQETENVLSRKEANDTNRVQHLPGELQHRAERQDTIPAQQSLREEQTGREAAEKTKIRLGGNRLIIENLPEDGVLEIYNIMGVKVYHRRVKAGNNQYILSLQKGYYIIKIGKLTRKIAVK